MLVEGVSDDVLLLLLIFAIVAVLILLLSRKRSVATHPLERENVAAVRAQMTQQRQEHATEGDQLTGVLHGVDEKCNHISVSILW